MSTKPNDAVLNMVGVGSVHDSVTDKDSKANSRDVSVTGFVYRCVFVPLYLVTARSWDRWVDAELLLVVAAAAATSCCSHARMHLHRHDYLFAIEMEAWSMHVVGALWAVHIPATVRRRRALVVPSGTQWHRFSVPVPHCD
jgi:hypothetical protein